MDNATKTAKKNYSAKTVSQILLELEPILAPDVEKIELLGLQRKRLQLRFHGRAAERFATDQELHQAIELVFQDNVNGVEAVDITIAGGIAGGEQFEIKQIDRSMNLGVIALNSSKAAEILTDWGLHCVGCFANSFDTVETGARSHGMSDQEIDDMISQVNKELSKSMKSS